MKKIIFTIALFWFGFSQAQNTFIVHSATLANSFSSASFIDHPDLNNNPSARIIAVHNWNPPGSTGVFNQSPTGVYYDPGENKWSVFNEDGTNMVVGTSYNVYIANGAAITHTHNGSAIHPDPVYSIVNHPVLNGNPAAIAVMTTYWNPFGVWNNANYGFWYDDIDNEWIIYNEALTAIPADAGFFVAAENPNVASMRHQATAGNITVNWTRINHPLLNGNPNAVFVFSHNWGVSGQTSNVVLNKTLGAWYTGSNWAIYTEDITAMPENATFDLLIYDPSLSTSEFTGSEIAVYPNPVKDVLTIESNYDLEHIKVFNTLGQLVLESPLKGLKSSIDLSTLSQGMYMVKIDDGKLTQTKKIIKQ